MIFRQLFEPASSTYTYLLADERTREALLIDPVMETVERDLEVLRELGLALVATLDTHVHADHITSACRLRDLTGSRIANPALDALPCTDIGIVEGVPFRAAGVELQPLFTPGHTDSHHCYYLAQPEGAGCVFTGDALLIDGCGRTDFQSGDAPTLYRSVTRKLFVLPDDTRVYPAHDYQQRRVSTIAQERARNPRLGGGRTEAEFVGIMAALELAPPKKIDVALPANRRCGAPAA